MTWWSSPRKRSSPYCRIRNKRAQAFRFGARRRGTPAGVCGVPKLRAKRPGQSPAATDVGAQRPIHSWSQAVQIPANARLATIPAGISSSRRWAGYTYDANRAAFPALFDTRDSVCENRYAGKPGGRECAPRMEARIAPDAGRRRPPPSQAGFQQTSLTGKCGEGPDLHCFEAEVERQFNIMRQSIRPTTCVAGSDEWNAVFACLMGSDANFRNAHSAARASAPIRGGAFVLLSQIKFRQ